MNSLKVQTFVGCFSSTPQINLISMVHMVLRNPWQHILRNVAWLEQLICHIPLIKQHFTMSLGQSVYMKMIDQLMNGYLLVTRQLLLKSCKIDASIYPF